MKNIEIVFENCEVMKIDAVISFDIIEDRDVIPIVDNVKLSINRDDNGVYYPFGYVSDETTKFTRILRYNDITQLVIDNKTYYIKWNNEEEYDWSQQNDFQKSYKDDDGNLTIEISSKNAFKDSSDARVINGYPTISKLVEELNRYKGLYGDIPVMLWDQLNDIGQIAILALYKSSYIDNSNKHADCIDIGFNGRVY